MAETCATVSLSRGGAVTMAIDTPADAGGGRGGDALIFHLARRRRVGVTGEAPASKVKDESVPGPAKSVPGPVPVLVLAHGAGNDFRSPFLEFFASALAARGVVVVRFNFPYKERPGTRPPDRMDVLADCFHDVVLAQARRTGAPPGPLFIGGKSMGGRVAAALVAAGRVRPTGLVFLGFPLHKAGDKEHLRTDDLPKVKAPMLFVQGTRDALCDIDLLRRVRKELKLPGALHEIDGGDHSFQLLKSQAARQRAEMDGAADAVARWVSRRGRS